MDATAVERVSRFLANRRLSRREAICRSSAGAAATLAVGLTTRSAEAQEATPAVATPDVAVEDNKVQFLFVQSFEGGSVAAKEGAEGTYTLTLDHGLGQTLYFSDRPDRIAGAAPTDTFLSGLGFQPDNPPNAAVIMETAPGSSTIAVVELENPAYDAATAQLTYDVKVLEDWANSVELGFTEAPSDLAELAPSFGTAHLLIDDCPDWPVYCISQIRNTGRFLGNQGQCWCLHQFSCLLCNPKEYYQDLCTQQFPDICTSAKPCDLTASVGGTPFDPWDYGCQ